MKKQTTLTRPKSTREAARLRKQIAALKSEADQRAREAYAAGFDDGGDEPPLTFGGGVIGRGYRSLKMSVRDETSTSQEAAIERSYRQFATNPLAWATANIGTDYVWDDNGPTITAQNDEVQAVLDAHWTDDVNDWPGRGSQRVRDLRLYGELILEAFVRPADGRVRLGTIDPAELSEVITDADNRDEIIAVKLKAIQGETQNAGRLLKVITHSESERLIGVQQSEFAAARQYQAGDLIRRGGVRYRVVEANQSTDRFRSGWANVRVAECCYGRAWRVSEAAGTERRDLRTGARLGGRMIEDGTGTEINGQPYDGQCFLVQVNKTSIGLRGRPDGLALIDWLDRYDQMFFDILEWAALIKDIVWDLLITGGDDKEIAAHVSNFVKSIQSGKVFGHNEKVVTTPQNPDLKGADWAGLSDTVLNLIGGGSRYPVYMLGSGGDANLATATAQGGPTYKGFKTRQGIVKRFIIRILQYAVDCAVAAGKLPEYVTVCDEKHRPRVDENDMPIVVKAREAFSVVMPEIAPRDTAAAATAFSTLVTAVIAVVTAKLMSKRVGVEIIARGADLLGIEIDVSEMLAELEAEPSREPLAAELEQAQQQDVIEQNGHAADEIDRLLAGMNSGAREEPKAE